MSNALERRLWKDVITAEQKVIAGRRGGSDEPLAGLAISGGGIRSATFALGVLESLQACRLLPKFHYLSTVSGGGYIGSWLSANCRRHPDWLTADWTESIRHLRRHSSHMAPQVGFFSADTWSMVTIWLRNTLLIQATVILAIACALLVPYPLFWVFHQWPQTGHLRVLPAILVILGIVGIAGNHWQLTARAPLELRPHRGPDGQPTPRHWRPVDLLRAQSWVIGGSTALVFVLLALLTVWLFDFNPYQVVDRTLPSGEALERTGAAFLIAGLLVLSGFVLQPVAMRIVATRTGDMPTQVNYTQGYVQVCVVMPLMAASLLVTAILWAQATGHSQRTALQDLTTYSALVTQGWKFWPFDLAFVFVSFWLLSICAISSRHEPKRLLVALMAPAAAVAALHLLLAAIVLIFQQFNTHIGGEWMAFVWGPPLLAVAFVLSIVVLIGMLGHDAPDGVRESWTRLGAWLAIYATAWMVVTLASVFGPLTLNWILAAQPTSYLSFEISWQVMTVLGGWIATVVGGLYAGNSASTGGDRDGVAAKTKDIFARVAPLVFVSGVLISVSFGLHLIISLNGGNDWWTQAAPPPIEVPVFMLMVCLAATMLLAWRVDINEFSLNAFLKSRFVRCYLGATRDVAARNPLNSTGFDDHDDMDLAFTGDESLNGPLHIINCSLDLGASSDLALNSRPSAPFTLSPLHCGSAYLSRDQQGNAAQVGYIATGAFSHRSGGPTLGEAMVISGAAASPDIGFHTSTFTSFLLTLFSARLGWWFPNPLKHGNGVTSPHFSLSYLTAALFAAASDKSTVVRVSDGGHFDNTATYELIRRKCAVIVIVDGECDAGYSFDGLGGLIRICEVDFGCRIAVDVDDLRPGTFGDKWSKRRVAVGDVTYHDGSIGTLIYIKASMTGKEDTSIRQYKFGHPTFPHEATGNHFSGEAQFESYRRLGRDIGSEVFGLFVGATSLVDVADKMRAARS